MHALYVLMVPGIVALVLLAAAAIHGELKGEW